MAENKFLIIMAGGVGTRFWPESRVARPKQYLDMLGTGKSLLQLTFERFLPIFPLENIFVVTSTRYLDMTAEALPTLPAENILAEPVARNTAPCIAYAASKIHTLNSNAVIFVSPSDQFVAEESRMKEIVESAMEACMRNPYIMTLGIKPSRPDTGYGYIQFMEEKESKNTFRKVKTFTEKPDPEIAQVFVESGEFLWNSGMFCFSMDTFRKALQEFLPDMYDLFESLKPAFGSKEEMKKTEEIYSRCLNVSIDYGIMEKAPNVYVIPANITWSDLGTWGSSYDYFKEKDAKANAVSGKVMLYDSSGNLVKISDSSKLVVLQGMKDFIVVDTGDVLLICKKDKEQKVRDFVADVRKNFGEKYV